MSSSPSALDALVQEAASLLRALRSQGERLQHVDIANVAAALALHYGFYRKTNGKPNPTAAARAFGKETAHPGAVLNWLERIKQIKKINEEVTDQISSEAAQCEEVISQLLRDKAFTAELSHPLEDEDEAVYRVLSRLGFESPATTSPVSSSPASSQPKSKEFMAIERLIACIGPAGMERIMGTAFIVAMDDKNIYLATCAHVLLDMPEDDERNPAEHGVRIGFGGNPIKWYESRAHVRYLSIPPPSYFKQKADKLASELVRLSSTPDPTVQRVLTAAQTAAARAEAATTPNADLRQIIPEHWLNSNNLIVDNKSGGEDIALLQLARVPDMPQLKTCPFADALLGAHAVFAGYGQSGPVCSAPQPMQAKISNFDASSGFLKIGGSMLPGQSGGPVVMKYTDNRRKRFLVVGICVRSTEKLVCEARRVAQERMEEKAEVWERAEVPLGWGVCRTPITHVLEAMERLELKAEWVDVFDESSTCSQCAVRSVRKHVPEPSERFGLEAKWVDVLDESSMSSQCADEWVQVLSNPHSAPSSSTLAASVDRTMMRAAQRHAFEAPTNGRADFDADSTGGTSTVGDAVEGQLVRRAENQPVDTFKNVVTRLVADFEHQRQLMEQLLSTAELEKKEARLREEQEKKEARSREAMIDEVNSFVSKAASATRDYERKIQYMQLGLADTLFKKKFCKLLALVKGHCDRYRFTRHAIHWLATPSPRAVHWRVAPSATRHPINRFVVVSDVNRAIVHSALKQLIRKLQTRPWSTLYLVAAQCLSDNMRMFVQHVCAEGVELDALLDQLNTWRSTTQTVDEIGAVIRRAERRVAVDCLLRFLSALNLDARASLRAERQTAVERETQKHAQEDAVFIQAVVSGDVQQAQEAYKTIKERGRP
ncbi:hypothetical protein AB1Y20_002748 [Prymnesium parvum]|uniref:Serine protease n=1 Tax=Prymnesium parvum TaxID=97485 RepID=A0AB34JA84_PRYPA